MMMGVAIRAAGRARSRGHLKPAGRPCRPPFSCAHAPAPCPTCFSFFDLPPRQLIGGGGNHSCCYYVVEGGSGALARRQAISRGRRPACLPAPTPPRASILPGRQSFNDSIMLYNGATAPAAM